MAGMRIAERQSQDDNNEGTAVSDKKRACTRSISPVGNKACWETLKTSCQAGSTCTIVAMRRKREHTVRANWREEKVGLTTGQNDEATARLNIRNSIADRSIHRQK